jgi:hypothetical protein
MGFNPPIGNSFPEGCLGVCNVYFDSMYMGQTDGTTELKPEEDNKEIRYAQQGTAPADDIPTGMKYTVTASLAEITTARLGKIWRGLTVKNNSAKIGSDIYSSRRQHAKVLKLIRINSEGQDSLLPEFTCVFYLASPRITSNFQFGADVQRNLGVEWKIYKDITIDKYGNVKGYGYWGWPSSAGAQAA